MGERNRDRRGITGALFYCGRGRTDVLFRLGLGLWIGISLRSGSARVRLCVRV